MASRTTLSRERLPQVYDPTGPYRDWISDDVTRPRWLLRDITRAFIWFTVALGLIGSAICVGAVVR